MPHIEQFASFSFVVRAYNWYKANDWLSFEME